jgi:hypothetical protein
MLSLKLKIKFVLIVFLEYVKTNIKSDELQVDCSVPSDGEYALVMKAKDSKEPEFKTICNYLLTTLENEEKSKLMINSSSYIHILL